MNDDRILLCIQLSNLLIHLRPIQRHTTETNIDDVSRKMSKIYIHYTETSQNEIIGTWLEQRWRYAVLYHADFCIEQNYIFQFVL